MPGYPRHHRHPKDLRRRDGTVRAVRLGGCLSTVVGFLAVVLVAAAGGWVVIRLLQAPIVEPVPFSPEDGVRAQQKIVGLVRRSTRAGSVVLSEAELNAFVSRHLDPADLPLREPAIRLRGDDLVNIVGTVSLGRLLNESPLAALAEALPAGWLARPIWLTVGARGRISTEPRRALRLDARRVVIGRQRVPALVLRLMLDPSSLRLMRVTLPRHVQVARVGRVVKTLGGERRRRTRRGGRAGGPRRFDRVPAPAVRHPESFVR